MNPLNCPREEGFRYFLHTLGRRFANPYPRGHEGHDLFEAGWRQAARVCGQAHLADLPLGEIAENLPVVSRGRPSGTVLPPLPAARGEPLQRQTHPAPLALLR